MNDRIPGTTYDNPIWHRKWRIYLASKDAYMFGGYNYEYTHDDYDGAEDAHDHRHGYAKTVEEAKAEIDEIDEFS